ncbi:MULTISPECIES: DeoR/GlpR family DNA-binding transcription regulator [Pseudoalteromonas]|uniref:DeoR/GlpR family DNA-binding transcription regulator n=1 Tax=Pseudoalteromonas haloplanktis TaxID=228 RepID=A0ABU1BHW9_PSEHA|nr:MULTISPECIES: DeoR/GlpR family DNA-binding transcription regulator [Pseudoalteromonas]MCF6146118.1 DeoR family transcriptional regulator, ulaG and ulaABCDEF operon transcriptional repressor [Pseudoalteromonas mariniglutinosa NCIMB 1770]MDQ9093892.1 DeoR/GlpR family DNA-binding transcription regulator [Pseudoalteromonas haloplanktis]TMN74079.1 DeoR/GlpR transcriptional regulator [Pseudoalteromonas sp. S1727]
MLEKHRQQLIKEIVDQQSFASVKVLTDKLSSSEATIRRDLTKMAKRGEIVKIRGGAQSNSNKRKNIQSSAFNVDKTKRTDTKKLIAKRAVELCAENDSIIINGGSSTYMMGEYLTDKNLNILTNSFVLANYLSENSNNLVSLPGGEIYREQGIILSSYEKDNTEHYRSSMMFMGTPGIGKFGVMESDPLLILSEQKLKKQTDKLIVLADSTKLGKRSNFVFCPLEEVDVLITDSKADKELIDYFKDQDIEVIIVDSLDD